jgi:FkbM family methyltransferase
MKWLKYRLKAQVLARSPAFYWGARRLVSGLLEPEMKLLPHLCRSDLAFLDIGANWGAYLFAALGHSASAHAFEPQPTLAAVLTRAHRRNQRVLIHNVALSNQSGFCEIRIPRNDIGYSTIQASNRLEGKADLSRGVEAVRVQTQRIDELSLPEVACIKIDVEGHEQEVLEGGLGLLARDRPAVLVEVEERHRRGSRAAVHRVFEELGYNAFTLCGERLTKFDPHSKSAEDQRNLVFLHPSRDASYTAILGKTSARH